jgi:hypothetical protein
MSRRSGWMRPVIQAAAGKAAEECSCRKPNPCSSCRMLVLMEHPAEPVASSYVKARDSVRSCQRHGQWLERAGVRDALMGPVPVVATRGRTW